MIDTVHVADDGRATRERLLEVAGEVFAERGYRHATVREICKRARANIAAVNYHFHDKEALYREALQYWFAICQEKYPLDLGLGPKPTAEQRLRAFIRSFLHRILDKSRPAWHGRLMAQELAEPTPALGGMIEDCYRPLNDRLRQIVRDLGGARLDEEEVRLCSYSILGQCLYFRYARPAIEKLSPQQRFEPADIERLAAHVGSFSLRAIRQMARG